MVFSQTKDSRTITDTHAVWIIHELAKNNGHMAKKATVSVWMTRDSINRIYEELQKKDGADFIFDGCRVYLGMYPEKFPGLPPELKKRSTMVFIPTKPHSNTPGVHVDDIAENRVRQIINSIPTLESAPAHEEGFDIENHGELCPPNNCQGTVIGGEVYNDIP